MFTVNFTEATRITLAPLNVDVTVGENATMQCIASHDPTLDLTFIWSLNGFVIDFEKEHEHYERNVMVRYRSFLICGSLVFFIVNSCLLFYFTSCVGSGVERCSRIRT